MQRHHAAQHTPICDARLASNRDSTSTSTRLPSLITTRRPRGVPQFHCFENVFYGSSVCFGFGALVSSSVRGDVPCREPSSCTSNPLTAGASLTRPPAPSQHTVSCLIYNSRRSLKFESRNSASKIDSGKDPSSRCRGRGWRLCTRPRHQASLGAPLNAPRLCVRPGCCCCPCCCCCGCSCYPSRRSYPSRCCYRARCQHHRPHGAQHHRRSRTSGAALGASGPWRVQPQLLRGARASRRARQQTSRCAVPWTSLAPQPCFSHSTAQLHSPMSPP